MDRDVSAKAQPLKGTGIALQQHMHPRLSEQGMQPHTAAVCGDGRVGYSMSGARTTVEPRCPLHRQGAVRVRHPQLRDPADNLSYRAAQIDEGRHHRSNERGQ